jgi:1-acyl-sn-glycerol-3-phosphate acyltransferase
MAALPIDCRFVANHELKAVPLIGTAIRKIGHLTVDRGARRDQHACLRAMIDTLGRGMSILVFPEATISPGPQLLPFRAGAFRAATEAGRPVVAISLRGTREIWPYRSWMLHQGAIDVRFHEPVQPVDRGRQEAGRLRDWARGKIASGLDDPS